MLKFIFAPRWFYDLDLLFNLFFIIVPLLISLYTYKIYKFASEKKYKYFAFSFFSISLGFFFRLVSHSVAYYEPIKKLIISIIIFKSIKISQLIYFTGFFMYVFFILAGLLGIFLVLLNLKSKKIFLLFFYFVAINAASVSFVPYFLETQKNPFYYTFHLTASVILFFISHSYYKHYKRRKNTERFLLFFSFLLLFFSQIVFMLIFTDYPLYVAGQILQLVAYSIILYDYILIVGRKRK